MPAERRRMMLARSINRWLTTSASEGTSFSVAMKNFEVFIGAAPALSLSVGCGKIVEDSNLRRAAVLDKEGYRPNVGIILANQRNEVFWGKRVHQHAWQFPQGGIQGGETPLQAMYRELGEEIGLQRAHVRTLQADFFPELAVHRLQRGLAALDAALRELPGVLVHSLAPEHLVPLVGKDDADVRTVAFLVEHRCTPQVRIFDDFSTAH